MINHIYLHHLTCFLADFPSTEALCFDDDFSTETNNSGLYGNGSLPDSSNISNQTCYSCLWRALYLFDDQTCVQGENCVGYMIFSVCAFLCVLVGIFGFVTNILIVIVLKEKSSCAPSLSVLLVPLAICDGVTSVLAGIIFCGTSFLALANITRSVYLMQTMYISITLGYYTRTLSMFLAVIITIERYFVVAKPLKAREWFTVRKTKQFSALATVLALVANAPRWFDSKWTYIGDGGDVNGRILPHHKLPSYEHYPYIVEYSDFAHPFYDKYCELYFVLDFMIPLPTLLVFNFLLYRQVGLSNNERRTLHHSSSVSQQTEVNTAKMFAVVVIILLLCHVLPIIYHVVIGASLLMYRDFAFVCFLTIGINCAVNFVIYCAFGKAFRDNFKKLFLTKRLNLRFGNSRKNQDSSIVKTLGRSISGMSSGSKSSRLSSISTIEVDGKTDII